MAQVPAEDKPIKFGQQFFLGSLASIVGIIAKVKFSSAFSRSPDGSWQDMILQIGWPMHLVLSPGVVVGVGLFCGTVVLLWRRWRPIDRARASRITLGLGFAISFFAFRYYMLY
jgi:hypothetical protein